MLNKNFAKSQPISRIAEFISTKEFIKRVLRKDSWLRLYRLRKHMINELKKDNAIIVFSECKTGTNSLCETIHQKYPEFPKRHGELMGFHRLGQAGLNYEERKRALYSLHAFTFWHKILNMYTILSNPKIKKINHRFRLVTNVRDPLATQWSLFAARNKDYIMEQPIEIIYSKFKQVCNGFKDATTCWFDEVYLPDTGINVYDYNFDKKKGYGFVGDGKIRGMIIKSEAARKESLSPQASENTDTILHALHEFTGMPIPKWWVETEEDSLDKVKYYKRYKEVIRSFVADDDYLDYIYNSKYIKHFYTEEEIAGFRIKWKQKDIG